MAPIHSLCVRRVSLPARPLLISVSAAVAERRMLVHSGPRLGARDCVYDLGRRIGPWSRRVAHTHTAFACHAAAHCLRPYARPLCRLAAVLVIRPSARPGPRRLLMNDPGSLRARRACCEVLFKAIAPLSLVYIFTTHKPAHITMRILLCGTSEMRSSDLLPYNPTRNTQNKDCR